MSMYDFIQNIKESRFDFKDSELNNLRIACTDMYKILKGIFDTPRREKKYTSVQNYKILQERKYRYPDEFYKFDFNNIVVAIYRRRGDKYSVGVQGITINDVPAMKTDTEKEFLGGFDFFGEFKRDRFAECIELFLSIVSHCIYRQYEFHFNKGFSYV